MNPSKVAWEEEVEVEEKAVKKAVKRAMRKVELAGGPDHDLGLLDHRERLRRKSRGRLPWI